MEEGVSTIVESRRSQARHLLHRFHGSPRLVYPCDRSWNASRERKDQYHSLFSQLVVKLRTSCGHGPAALYKGTWTFAGMANQSVPGITGGPMRLIQPGSNSEAMPIVNLSEFECGFLERN